MDIVRLGIIGVGSMGTYHARYLLQGEIARCNVTALCDINPERLAPYDTVRKFDDSAALIRSGEVDAVLIVTPHYSHTTIGIDALQQGLHVVVEKPISAHKADAERLLAAHTNKKQIFSTMFMTRTDPRFRAIRRIIQEGELGELRRVNWIITNWFRSQAYYASGGWRATWAGEGGGVLLNQAPHNLDLLQWLCGMPARVRAFCQLGKYHNVEVEDDVTAYFEYANGATGVLVATTGEAPGTDRLEITGDRGKVVLENGTIMFFRTDVSVNDYCKTTPEIWTPPAMRQVEVAIEGVATLHKGIMQNFVAAVLDGEPLIAPAEEGINSLELANAMLYSSFKSETVELPLDSAAYAEQLRQLIATSNYSKEVSEIMGKDMVKSFA